MEYYYGARKFLDNAVETDARYSAMAIRLRIYARY